MMDTIKIDIKKNGLTDVNILDRKDWILAVSRATHCRGRAFNVRKVSKEDKTKYLEKKYEKLK